MITTTPTDLAGVEGGRVKLTSKQLEDLDSRIEGSLLCAGDDGWDDAVLVWNAMVAKVPALVVQPESAQDVAVAVGFARDHGLLLSIKGGGHNIAGTSIAEGGLTLDMARMRDVVVDPEARLAHVGPGCRLRDVDRRDAGARASDDARLRVPDRRRRPHSRRRVRLPDAQIRLGGRQPRGGRDRHRRRRDPHRQPPTRTPTSSGRSGAAAATSASSPASRSACTRSARWSRAA